MNSVGEVKLTCAVDTDFLTKAESDIYDILLCQRRAFNQRWHRQKTMNKIKTVLRYVALFLCVVCILVLLFMLVAKDSWLSIGWQTGFLLVFFFAGTVFFYRLPLIETKMQAWTDRISQKSCKKLAKKCVKQAEKMSPFEAVYEIKGLTISYYRRQNSEQGKENWQFVWNRTMNDYAMQGEHATVFFKKPTAIQPKIVVLHTDRQSLSKVLIKQGIDSTPVNGSVA